MIYIIDCGDPPPPDNGTVTLTISGNTKVGSTATQACKPGYDLHSGTVNISCGVGGSWSALPAICSLRGTYIYSNKKETFDFHGTVSPGLIKMSKQK